MAVAGFAIRPSSDWRLSSLARPSCLPACAQQPGSQAWPCVCRISMDADTIRQRLQELAFLNSAATITYTVRNRPASRSSNGSSNGASFNGEQDVTEEVMHHSGGLVEFVGHLNRSRQPLHPSPLYLCQTVGNCCLMDARVHAGLSCCHVSCGLTWHCYRTVQVATTGLPVAYGCNLIWPPGRNCLFDKARA